MSAVIRWAISLRISKNVRANIVVLAAGVFNENIFEGPAFGMDLEDIKLALDQMADQFRGVLRVAGEAGLQNAVFAGEVQRRQAAQQGRLGIAAGTTLLGNLVITLDPVFAGLAWAIIFGLITSTLFTLVVVPCAYYLLHADKEPPTPCAP